MPLDGSDITQVIPSAVWLKHDIGKGYWSFKVFVSETVSFISIIYDSKAVGVTEKDYLIGIGDTIAREAISHVNMCTVPLYGLEVVIPC